MPSYQLKRTYQTGFDPTAKRARMTVSKLNRQLALRTPEIKDTVIVRTLAQLNNDTLSSAGIFTAIVQGALGSQRNGDRIRVLSISVSGSAYGGGGLNQTFALVRPNSATLSPQLTDFAACVGGHYDESKGWVVHQSFRDVAIHNSFQNKTFKFGSGMVVRYDPPSTAFPNGFATKNEIYAVNLNKSGINVTDISYSIRVRFVDM